MPVEAAPSVREALAAATATLEQAGCESARLDAELLAAEALGVERAWLYANALDPLPADARERLDGYVSRRARREPVAYILGRKGFRHIELRVDRRVLVPRPETELLVEVALELPRGASVHDVGTGSGAVALAIKHERPDLRVTASDVSPGAVEVARANAERLGLEVPVEVADGLPPGRRPALVVANLPYVGEGERASLAPEIGLYEPAEALFGGVDGLDSIRALVAQAEPGVRLALEHAPAQAVAVRALLREAATLRDLAGRERVTVGTAP
ncbi:MAG: peptide chain release factor N(5)-glutamine methyltransferase [Thermoleophilaceae bacterium]|nr:peptide chain release factor N(5)-glutamine methyltransferase [Thermoleophilaceae bacterium]